MFIGADNTPLRPPESTDGISLAALTAGNINLRNTIDRGGNLSAISLGGGAGGSYISIRFSENINHIGGRFEYSIFLSRGTAREGATLIRITGQIEAEIIEISENDIQVDTSDGSGVLALEAVRRIEFNLGSEVTITRNLVRGRTYYGRAHDELRTRDFELIDRYDGVSRVIRLETSGLKTPGNIVRFDLDQTYYVYNTFGLYLGRSIDALPWWSTYYLSTVRYPHLSGLV
jgi:hypothetical protein